VNPHRIYDILLDSKKFTALTGAPATIDPKAGGGFSMLAASSSVGGEGKLQMLAHPSTLI
jgi:hypothetical protein